MIDCHVCQVRPAVSTRVLTRGGVFPLCSQCRRLHGVYPKRAKTITKPTINEVPKCPTYRQTTFI